LPWQPEYTHGYHGNQKGLPMYTGEMEYSTKLKYKVPCLKKIFIEVVSKTGKTWHKNGPSSLTSKPIIAGLLYLIRQELLAQLHYGIWAIK
jgi:hypothetical protein